jgi:hypothetical protein
MIREHQVVDLLRAATDDVVVPVAPAQALATAGRRRRRRRTLAGMVNAGGVGVVAVTVALVLVLRSPGSSVVTSVGPPTTAPGGVCVDPVPSRVLPRWARAGFSDPRPRMPYVVGDDGEIAAILFAQPLNAPPSPDHTNKILWVARVGGGTSLRITATLTDGSVSTTRVIAGGPGPSIVDLPQTGCWHLTLAWGRHTDTLDLAYQAP